MRLGPKFFDTHKGRLLRHRHGRSKRVHVFIDDVEPQSKKMPSVDRDRFRASVLRQLDSFGRSAFRGPIALDIDLSTTSKNAPQAHTIAKNLLDLLSQRSPSVAGKRASILYKDDRQIQGLAVSCRHGQDRPSISIGGRPFSSMLDDLELAAEATRELETADPAAFYEKEQEQEWIDDFRAMIRDESGSRARLGDDLHDAFFRMNRWYAQRALLSRSPVDIPVLTWLYDRPKGALFRLPGDTWAELVGGSKLRLQIGELPSEKGSSDAFRMRISEEVSRFKQRWDWLIQPLVIAVGLEVIVRPNQSTSAAVLHDLDNIVRDYLLPQIVPAFGTVSDHCWTIDFEELRRRDPELADRWGANPTPPKGTRAGVTRYEAWRLPPSITGAPGFVSVALVADVDGGSNLIHQCDERIDRWVDQLDKGSTRRLAIGRRTRGRRRSTRSFAKF